MKKMYIWFILFFLLFTACGKKDLQEVLVVSKDMPVKMLCERINGEEKKTIELKEEDELQKLIDALDNLKVVEEVKEVNSQEKDMIIFSYLDGSSREYVFEGDTLLLRHKYYRIEGLEKVKEILDGIEE